MTFEGQQMQGAVKIMEKVSSLTFQKIQRSITACDAQPTFDGGVLISVLGQLKVILFDFFGFFFAERLLKLDRILITGFVGDFKRFESTF